MRVRGFLRRSGAPCEGQGQRWDAEGIHTGYARMFFDHKLELCGEEGPCSGSSWAAGDACNRIFKGSLLREQAKPRAPPHPLNPALTQKDPEVGRGVMGEKKGKKIPTFLITSHPSGIGLSFRKRQVSVWRDREVWSWM